MPIRRNYLVSITMTGPQAVSIMLPMEYAPLSAKQQQGTVKGI
jgi:hypothetical protein